MAHRIIWLPAAAQDLQEISDFVGQTSRAYADSLIERILDAVEDLTYFPGMGPVVREVRIKGIELRETSVRPYRVIYRLRHDRVMILGVIHGARLLRKAIRGRRME
jgi:plasmid stabilization system protein ParE